MKDRYAPKRNHNFKKKQTKVTADDNNTARKLPTDNNSNSNYELLETASSSKLGDAAIPETPMNKSTPLTDNNGRSSVAKIIFAVIVLWIC